MRQMFFTPLAVLLFCAAATADEAVDKELKRFQGDWQIVSITRDGEVIKGDALKGKIWRFEGNKLIPLDNKDDSATVTLDPSKKPATLDIKDKEGDVVQGIYKFNGDDKMTICGRGDSKRPKEFDGSKGSEAMVFELERVKK